MYRGFIDAVNRQDLNAAEQFIVAAHYRENRVGFTHGSVGWEEAQKSVRQVWNGLPDLKVKLAPSWPAPTPPALQPCDANPLLIRSTGL